MRAPLERAYKPERLRQVSLRWESSWFAGLVVGPGMSFLSNENGLKIKYVLLLERFFPGKENSLGKFS